MSGPLEGLQVTDLVQGYGGYCGMMLADLGATVTKVEPPEGDFLRGHGPPFVGSDAAAFVAANRSKKSVRLDWMRDDSARAVLDRLIEHSDVLLSDLYADDAASYGLDYTTLGVRYPRLVSCAFTPFGSTGPMANHRASELEVQGYSGQWRYVGDLKREPIRIGVPIAAMSGALFAFQGVMAALIERATSGSGQEVEISQLGSQVTMQTVQLVSESEPDDWIGHCLAPYRPPNRGYRTADRAILWGFKEDQPAMDEFCRRLGLPEEFARGDAWNVEVARGVFEDEFAKHASEELIEWVRELGGQSVPYYTYSALADDPQAQALGLISEFDHPEVGKVRTIGLPWEFSDIPAIHGRAPLLGEHTDAVLSTLGVSTAEIVALGM